MIQIFNSAAAQWGEFFLLAVIQNTIFLGLVFAALHILRNAPARVRYLVALAGLVKLVLPPFLRIPSLPAISEKAMDGYGHLIPFISGSGGGSSTLTSAAAGETLTPAAMLLGIWSLILVAGLVVSVAASARLALKLRQARPVNVKYIPAIPGIEDVRVLRSGNIAMPITVAFLPDRIYVPAAWDGWTSSCRRMLLLHEMAHLNRHDGIVVIMQIFARAIYFFHPLVAVLDRRLSEYREMACDDATVGRDRDSGVEYSRYLVEIAETVVRCPAVCGSASALIRRKNELLRRVSYQLEEGRMRSISRTRVMVLMAAIVLLAVSLSWYRGEASAGSDVPLLPAQPAAPVHPAPPSQESTGSIRSINVLLRSDGAMIDDEKVSMDELVTALEVYSGEAPENVVVKLVCADDVPMSDVRIFQETLMKLGISKISYINSDGEGLPLQLPPQNAIDRLAEMPAQMIIDIFLFENGDANVGFRKVEPDELKSVLEDELEKQPLAIVVLQNDANTSYGHFAQVLKVAKNCGAERIVVKFSDDK